MMVILVPSKTMIIPQPLELYYIFEVLSCVGTSKATSVVIKKFRFYAYVSSSVRVGNSKMHNIFVISYCIVIVYASFKTIKADQTRLSDDVEPLSYELKIRPNYDTFTFSGKVTIRSVVKFSTNVVKFHCKNLKIKDHFSKEVVEEEGEQGSTTNLSDEEFKASQTDDFCIFTHTDTFKFDTIYNFVIEYEGILREDGKGFYRTSYEVNGEKKWMFATNFYGIHAREVFPCFDEPRFRTPFTLFIARKKNQKVTSNMPFVESHPHSDKNLIWDKFRKSSPIPTYLVAFVINEYSSLPDSEGLIEIQTRPNINHYAQHALIQSKKILTQLENTIGISYQLSKLNIVAVSKVQYELADNWGLYLLTEDYIIADEEKLSQMQNVIITAGMCHLFARHWFGGQVTPAVWDYSWLSEAFAGYMEFFVTDSMLPCWRLDLIFNIEMVQSALWHELANPGALTCPKISESEINQKYGSINYRKGASIIRMLEHIISRSSLKSVIHRYLTNSKNLRNGLVTPNDLFQALQYQSDVDSFPVPVHLSIVDVMKLWTENMGYPVMNVTRNENNQIQIEQQTYRSQQAAISYPDQKWITPINYATKSKPLFSKTAPTDWITDDMNIISSIQLKSTDWIICNLQRTGYYRVNYDMKNWLLIIEQLQKDMKIIHVLNRAQLIDDSFTFAFEGDLPYSVPLKLAEYLEKETEMVPLLSAIFHLDMLYKKYEGTASRVFFCMYIQKILEKQIQSIGFDVKFTDDCIVKIAKPSLLLFACKIGLSSCVSKALLEYKSHISDLSKVQPDLKEVVYCTALRSSQDEEETVYKNLWKTYLASDIAYEKITILKALGCSRSENLLKETLSKIFYQKDHDIDTTYENYIYNSILSSSNGIIATLKFVLERITEMGQFSEDKLITLKTILNRLELKVYATEHLKIIKRIEKYSNTWETNKYGDIVNTIQRIKITGMKRAKENNKMSDNLKPIFYEILNIESPKIPEKQNQAFIQFPSIFLCFICISIINYFSSVL